MYKINRLKNSEIKEHAKYCLYISLIMFILAEPEFGVFVKVSGI